MNKTNIGLESGKIEKKNTHGGRREGAGRPKTKCRDKAFTVTTTQRAVDCLNAYCTKTGKSKADVVTELLEGLGS